MVWLPDHIWLAQKAARAASKGDSWTHQGAKGQSKGGFGKQQSFGEPASTPEAVPKPAGYDDIASFVAYWGLDEKCQEVLISLDPASQQRVMNGFHPPELARANKMFMGFARSVKASGGGLTAQEAFGGGSSILGGTGNPDLEGFVAQWMLDERSQEVLYGLDAATQQRLMSGFYAPDLGRANRMFMGFVKSVTGKGGGGAPTAQQAWGGSSSNFQAAYTGNNAIDGFVAHWGLDEQAQLLLCSLDPATQQTVMNDFYAPDLERSSRMFMGFVKSVAGKTRAPTAQQAFGGGNSTFYAPSAAPAPQQALGEGQPPVETGNAAIDTFVAAWGLDSRAQEVLCKLDIDQQLRVMNEFAPSDISRANQIFMGFVRTVVRSQGGAPAAQQPTAPQPTAQQPMAQQPMAQQPTAQQAFESTSSFQGGAPTAQQMFDSSSSPQGGAPALATAQQNFGNSSTSPQVGAPTPQQAFGSTSPAVMQDESPEGQLQMMMDLLQQMSQPTTGSGFDKIDPATFVTHWGLDQKSQDVLSTLDPNLQQKVMSSFQPKDLTRANQIFMGFVKSVRAPGGAAAQQAFGGHLQAPGGTGNPVIDGFLIQWGLDGKCQEVLCGLDPATQQRVMSGFNAPDLSRANQMFMGFVKSVVGRTLGSAPTAQQTVAIGGNAANVSVGAVMPGINAFVAQWGLDHKCREVLSSLDPATQERVMTGFAPPDMAQASRMFMGFVKSVSGKGSRFTPY